MRTVTAWIVDVFRDADALKDGDVAWTEIYEDEENARSAARLIERAMPFHVTEVYEDECDLWDDDVYDELLKEETA